MVAKNKISSLQFKRDRVVAKLDLAEAHRQGRIVVYGVISVDANNDTVFDITKQSVAPVTPQVGWSLTTAAGTGAITNVEDLSAVLWRITYAGPAASPDAGDVVTIISTEDVNAPAYRVRNQYDLDLLPTLPGVGSNDPVDRVNNPNVGGLQPGRPWIVGAPAPVIPIFSGVATGGTVTTETIDDVVYNIHTFSGDDDFDCDSEIPYLEYLLVAGGGSGGTSQSSSGGGGGAGGVLHNIGTGTTLSANTYPVVIGIGGAEITANSAPGNNGTASTFNNLTAVGGGRGGRGGIPIPESNGGNGGSGGGGGVVTTNGIGVPGSGTAGQGSDGGSPFSDATAANTGGGGGGGAGEVGGDAAFGTGGKGGDGVELNFDGTLRYYGGGGGGAGDTGQTGAGGLGGGSAGVRNGTSVAGTDGLGGGSGGNRGSGGTGKGGDGVVMIRYRVA